MAGLISYLMKKTNEHFLLIKSIIKTAINYAYAFTSTQNREFPIKLLGLDFKGGETSFQKETVNWTQDSICSSLNCFAGAISQITAILKDTRLSNDNHGGGNFVFLKL